MKVAIISIGREILKGRVLDSNSNYIARHVTGLGHTVCRVAQIDDRLEDIIWEVKYTASHPVEMIITTGGLGPTGDDMQLRAIAKAFDRECAENAKALEIVKERYETFYREGAVDSPELTPERRKMACLPSGAEPLYNPVGAAPAMKLVAGGLTIFSLPGVPSEMKAIFEREIVPLLSGEDVYVERFFTSPCKDESRLATFVREFLARHPHLYLKSVPVKFGDSVRIEVVIGVRAKRGEVDSLIEKYMKEFLKMVKEPC